MANNQIEIILSRQLADSLSIPSFLVDTAGNLLFYNEPAELLLGIRFEDTGCLPVEEWSSIFQPRNKDGELLAPEDLPLVQTLNNQMPAHGHFWIHSFKGEIHHISVTSYPIIGRPKRFLGAVALFWQTDSE